MFAVGALDAYFCDAYSDIVAAAVISKNRRAPTALPDFFYDIKFPVRAILEPYTHQNWRWRMAARKMIERENVLSLATIQTLFNKFFRRGQKLFRDLLPIWISHPDARRIVFGITPEEFAVLTGSAKASALDEAQGHLEDRFWTIFQRRHDCIHNCDRPRVAPQLLAGPNVVSPVIEDIAFLVHRCDEHITSEFRHFLIGCGCPASVIGQAGY